MNSPFKKAELWAIYYNRSEKKFFQLRKINKKTFVISTLCNFYNDSKTVLSINDHIASHAYLKSSNVIKVTKLENLHKYGVHFHNGIGWRGNAELNNGYDEWRSIQ